MDSESPIAAFVVLFAVGGRTRYLQEAEVNMGQDQRDCTCGGGCTSYVPPAPPRFDPARLVLDRRLPRRMGPQVLSSHLERPKGVDPGILEVGRRLSKPMGVDPSRLLIGRSAEVQEAGTHFSAGAFRGSDALKGLHPARFLEGAFRASGSRGNQSPTFRDGAFKSSEATEPAGGVTFDGGAFRAQELRARYPRHPTKTTTRSTHERPARLLCVSAEVRSGTSVRGFGRLRGQLDLGIELPSDAGGTGRLLHAGLSGFIQPPDAQGLDDRGAEGLPFVFYPKGLPSEVVCSPSGKIQGVVQGRIRISLRSTRTESGYTEIAVWVRVDTTHAPPPAKLTTGMAEERGHVHLEIEGISGEPARSYRLPYSTDADSNFATLSALSERISPPYTFDLGQAIILRARGIGSFRTGMGFPAKQITLEPIFIVDQATSPRYRPMEEDEVWAGRFADFFVQHGMSAARFVWAKAGLIVRHLEPRKLDLANPEDFSAQEAAAIRNNGGLDLFLRSGNRGAANLNADTQAALRNKEWVEGIFRVFYFRRYASESDPRALGLTVESGQPHAFIVSQVRDDLLSPRRPNYEATMPQFHIAHEIVHVLGFRHAGQPQEGRETASANTIGCPTGTANPFVSRNSQWHKEAMRNASFTISPNPMPRPDCCDDRSNRPQPSCLEELGSCANLRGNADHVCPAN